MSISKNISILDRPLAALLELVFSTNGVLSKAITGFKPRQAQNEMAGLVANAIEQDSILVIEAGTGTGKTFAYLVPALLARQKTIISTGSKNLQDQLFKKDLPTISQALKYSGKIALLKGRANYLCLERLAYLEIGGALGDKSILSDIAKVQKWRNGTKTGDFSECHTLAEDSPIIPQLVSSTESCLGSDCAYYADCYVVQARKRAMEADIVVVNHHLFFADMAVKESGFAELIPEAKTIIFDEAHQLPDIASQYFGQSLTSRQLFDLAKDIQIIYRTEIRDMKQLGTASDKLQKTVQDLRLLLGEGNSKGNLRHIFSQQAVLKGVEALQDAFQFASEVIQLAEGRSQALASVRERLTNFAALLTKLSHTEITGYCYWYETLGRQFGLHITPLNVAEKFSEKLQQQKASWIFTSATLEVGGSFRHYCQRLGIEQAEQKILASPFDYAQQAMLCVPRYLPTTNQQYTLQQLAEMLLPIIKINQGHCFLLCTSYFMMKGLAEYLREHSQLNILLQGETSKGRLLEQFIQNPKSVLVATQSFWEGVDVRGKALSLVIIDKLPFVAPDEPLLKARIEDCRLQGGDPFNDIQIPETVITLKQGVGRLIRDVTDKGAIIICDPRLVMRNYGEVFLKSLPPASRTRDLQKVADFLQRIQSETTIA